ncbi:MAG: DUF3108 domain-containing protein [Myxococcota bacterium]
MTRTATTLALLATLIFVQAAGAGEGTAEAGPNERTSSEGASQVAQALERTERNTADSEGADETEDAPERREDPEAKEGAQDRGAEVQVLPRPAASPALPRLRGPGRSSSLPRESSASERETPAAPRQSSSSSASSRRTLLAECEEPPRPAGPHPFLPGESLVFDIDVMGVRAGTLTLTVDPPSGGGHSFSAATRTNSFFENVREVEGRATSFSRNAGLRPLRYREDSTEDGVEKWSEVLFPAGRKEVDVRYGIGERERRVRYPVTSEPMDLLSLVYYLRTLELSAEDSFCLDVYANRRVWRVTGEVQGEEFVRTPAGGFETWHVAGKAQRLDAPNLEREVHFWIAQNERRTPVAVMSTIDLGPIRARLSRIDDPESPERSTPSTGGRW